MNQAPKHYLVEFASRHAGARFKTLTAGTALSRTRSLASDVEALLELKADAEQKDIRFGSRVSTYEIVSYFAVGFVTCLEWHARSRLVDTMVFQPSSIEKTDVKGIADVALSQMVAEGATIPHLLGAATNISRIDQYVSVFRRVFEVLKINADPAKELHAVTQDIYLPKAEIERPDLHTVIDSLFQYRNHLVHEIDISVVGHFNIRDMWELEHAKKYGDAVERCITTIESHITRHAPKGFPNRLDAEGFEADELEELRNEIAALEVQLGPKIDEAGTIHGGRSTWNDVLKTAHLSGELHFQFFEDANFLRPIRYLDRRREMKIEFLRSRLAFLLLLKSELE